MRRIAGVICVFFFCGCGLTLPFGRRSVDACGGSAALACGAGRYCRLDAGECEAVGGAGVCANRPESCADEEADPVCGCDAKTYASECRAAMAGVSVDYHGACEGRVCGLAEGAACAEVEYCRLAEGQCRRADAQGFCKPRPSDCSEAYEPICGCDGVTYQNACEAAASGISVQYRGECRAGACGGPAELPCADGEYCELPKGVCEVSSTYGLCRARPGICGSAYRPVCGCNDRTYRNACEAARAGANVAAAGECGAGGD